MVAYRVSVVKYTEVSSLSLTTKEGQGDPLHLVLHRPDESKKHIVGATLFLKNSYITHSK